MPPNAFQRNAKQLLRFIISGTLATTIHVVIVFFVMERIIAVASLANATAYTVATTVSYIINTTWSFNDKLTKKIFFRFCIVSLFGLILSALASQLAQAAGLSYSTGIIIVIATVTPSTFLLHSLWTYA